MFLISYSSAIESLIGLFFLLIYSAGIFLFFYSYRIHTNGTILYDGCFNEMSAVLVQENKFHMLDPARKLEPRANV
jgi:hypothetical protein